MLKFNRIHGGKEKTVYSDETGKVSTELSVLKWASEDAQAPQEERNSKWKVLMSLKKKKNACFTLKRGKGVQVVEVWQESLGQIGMAAV